MSSLNNNLVIRRYSLETVEKKFLATEERFSINLLTTLLYILYPFIQVFSLWNNNHCSELYVTYMRHLIHLLHNRGAKRREEIIVLLILGYFPKKRKSCTYGIK